MDYELDPSSKKKKKEEKKTAWTCVGLRWIGDPGCSLRVTCRVFCVGRWRLLDGARANSVYEKEGPGIHFFLLLVCLVKKKILIVFYSVQQEGKVNEKNGGRKRLGEHINKYEKYFILKKGKKLEKEKQ